MRSKKITTTDVQNKMIGVRLFSHTFTNLIKKHRLPPRPNFTPSLEAECEEKFLHGGRGPGGQKINKSNSKVQLKHSPTGIVVECQETRSRDLNRKIARKKMALEIERFNAADQNETIREQVLSRWHQQRKKSREKKSHGKHEQHRQEREFQRLERLKNEREIIKSITK